MLATEERQEEERPVPEGVRQAWVIPDHVFDETIREVVSENRDFSYKERFQELEKWGYLGKRKTHFGEVMELSLSGCYNECYFEKGEEKIVLRCLIGEVLYRILSTEVWRELIDKNNAAALTIYQMAGETSGTIALSPQVRRAARAAQSVQDSGQTWGEALEAYEAVRSAP